VGRLGSGPVRVRTPPRGRQGRCSAYPRPFTSSIEKQLQMIHGGNHTSRKKDNQLQQHVKRKIQQLLRLIRMRLRMITPAGQQRL